MVDKPGGDDPTIGVDGGGGRCIELANPHDLPIFHRDVGVEGGLAGAVNHSSVLDEEV